MRYILLIIFAFISTTLQAQDKKSDGSKKPLTKTELQKAIKMYEAMTHTPTYIALKKNDDIIFEKIGGIGLYPPPEEMVKWYDDKTLLRKWVSDNIKYTKFTSVDEGTKLISQTINLYVKRFSENKELYALMGRANKEEFKKIFAPERKQLPGMY